MYLPTYLLLLPFFTLFVDLNNLGNLKYFLSNRSAGKELSQLFVFQDNFFYYFWNMSFSRYRFWWIDFFMPFINHLIFPSLIVSDERSAILLIFVILNTMCFISLTAFKIFFLSLVFNNLIIIDLVILYLFCLVFIKPTIITDVLNFHKFRKLSAIIFSNLFFWQILLNPFFGNSYYMCFNHLIFLIDFWGSILFVAIVVSLCC